MVRVKVSVKSENEKSWGEHKELDFTRVPCIGEYISLSDEESLIYKVTVVAHMPFENAHQYSAELFAVKSNSGEAYLAAGWDK